MYKKEKEQAAAIAASASASPPVSSSMGTAGALLIHTKQNGSEAQGKHGVGVNGDRICYVFS
jgi:hypothetical protein